MVCEGDIFEIPDIQHVAAKHNACPKCHKNHRHTESVEPHSSKNDQISSKGRMMYAMSMCLMS